MTLNWEVERLFVRTKKNFCEAFKTLGEDVVLLLKYLFKQLPRDIRQFVVRIWDYLPLIWQDRDWEYYFILKMLEFKLKRTKKSIEGSSQHESAKKDIKLMAEALTLLDVIMNESAGDKLREAHDKKWGKANHLTYRCENKNYYRMVTVRERASTPKEKAQELREYRRMMDKEHKLQEKAWNRFWEILSQNLRSWWW